METDRNFNPTQREGPSRARRTAKNQPGTVSYGDLPKLRETLAGVPEARPEAVARARALISDPGFPSDEEQQVIAVYFAARLMDETGPSPL